ncbi:MAG: YebG family protein [Gammaproteobacteria bacterium]|nr:YebG family protein [Gammaproteobacteria bacterium]
MSTRDESKIWITQDEADAYDKKLEFAENLEPLLSRVFAKAELKLSDAQLESVALGLAEEVDNLRTLIPAQRKIRQAKTPAAGDENLSRS